MRIQGVFFRAHDPKWAWAPDSGRGAAIHGGRFNPKGTQALYLAGSTEGMFAEMGHGFDEIFQPMTICSYDVDVDQIVDLTSSISRKAEDVSLSQLGCAWEAIALRGGIPASWTIASKLIRQGAAGILIPSFAQKAKNDMLNLVLWRWGQALPCKVLVHDTDKRLPKDVSSWR